MRIRYLKGDPRAGMEVEVDDNLARRQIGSGAAEEMKAQPEPANKAEAEPQNKMAAKPENKAVATNTAAKKSPAKKSAKKAN